MVFDRDVTLACGKTDKYRREVCVVMVNGQDANLAQVKAGMAWWYRKYQMELTTQQRATYEDAETAARAGKVGLWREADPVPPWEWRHPKRELIHVCHPSSSSRRQSLVLASTFQSARENVCQDLLRSD